VPGQQLNSSSELPKAIADVPAAPSTLPQPAGSAPVVPQFRAALDTQSIPIESALALSVPRTLSLSPEIEPAAEPAPLLSTAVEAIDEAMLHSAGLPAPDGEPAEMADPLSPAVDSTLTATQLQTLPVSGRRWQEFLLDEPAAAASSDAAQPAFRGASAESAEITVEGVSTRLAFGASAGSRYGAADSAEDVDQARSTGRAWTGGRSLGVSEAAIREVTATAGNAEAEAMRAAGGRTAIRTESGGDALHGRAFLFDRQNTWGARNPFTQWLQNLGSVAAPNFTAVPFTPPDHELVWGLGAGGRIRRDKLFWFAALDSYRRNDPGLASVKNSAELFSLPEPTSADVTLLSAQLGESQNQAYNDYLGSAAPTPPPPSQPSGPLQPAGLEQLAALLGPAPRSATQWLGFGRIDWQVAERHRVTLEGTGADWNAPGGGLTSVSENYGSHSFGSSQASENWLLARWEAYLTPNLLAVTQASAGRDILSARPATPSAFEQTFLGPNVYGQLPQIVVDSRYGFTIGNPSRFGQGSYPDEKLYHAQESLDWVRGKMLLRAGFELDHNADATSMLRNQTGTYTYSKVQDFISDALVFQKLGLQDPNNYSVQHNCGATGTQLGSQPCYSHYSQTVGPTNWHLSTNDWAGYATAQWQASSLAVFSAGLRWELEQMPPPIAALANQELSQAGKMPDLGSNWGPRIGLAIGQARSHWPVLRLGYGMYYGRVENATALTALTQTGSLKGDLTFFLRPQDDCQHCSGGAPPFPYVFAGQPASVVKPGVVQFAPNFRNPEVHQAVAAIEQPLPGRVELTAEAMLSLGRRLPVSIDTNIDPAVNPQTITYTVCDETPATPAGSANKNGQCGNLGLGPIKASTITVPYYADWPAAIQGNCPLNANLNASGQCGRLNPDYQQIAQIMSRANSTYEAAVVKLVRYGPHGLSFHAHYAYAHAIDWNPDGITLGADSSVSAPPGPNQEFTQEYGTSNLDVRHSAAAMVIFDAPWKLHNLAGKLGNGWMLSGVGEFHSGLPYSMRITGSLPEVIPTSGPGNGDFGLGPSMNGYGGDNRFPGLPRNTFRYPNTWKADLRLGKKFNLGEMRELEVLAESFNLFNHQNVTEIETTGYTIDSGSSGSPPTLNFLTGLKTSSKTGLPIPAFGQPLNINATDFYRERQIQFGLRLRF